MHVAGESSSSLQGFGMLYAMVDYVAAGGVVVDMKSDSPRALRLLSGVLRTEYGEARLPDCDNRSFTAR
jgi:hypothetical protein